jgi:periplasmic copper chaperone A
MKSHNLQIFLLIIICLLIFTACGPKTPKIEISNAWIRPDPLWESAAGYFLITNTGNSKDTIVGITLTFAKFGIIHKNVMEGDINRMVLLSELDILPGGSIEFKPFNYHIMITGLSDGLEYGDKVIIEFQLEKSGLISVEAEIKSIWEE